MADLLYQTDSYLRQFDAVVVETHSDSAAVALDRTAFYPGGGGQPPDQGTLSGLRVTNVRRDHDKVWHMLEETPPAPRSAVHGTVDWERRYSLMRTHTAMHVLCGVVFRDYGALVTGGTMEPLRGRMDFEFPRLERSLVSEIEAAVNHEIGLKREVRVRILPREEAFLIPDLIRTKINLLPKGIEHVRTVEIAGLDVQADVGTHVANTAEIGQVHIVDHKSKGAANKRVYLEVEAA